MKKIDIIIPAFHAQSTIAKTLASIAMQTIADQCTVYVCNDNDGIGYADIIRGFEPQMEIHELTLPENGGCGVARQYGIDRSHSQYFICQDADDTFASAFSVEILMNSIENDPKAVMVSGAFIEQVSGELKFVMHNNDMIWMHAKLYKRAFIDKYQIRFNTTRSNEDNGFNTLCRLCSNENEKVMFIPDVVHYWHFKADSITRINNFEYTYNQSFIGYADNMTWAVQKAKTVNPLNPANDIWAIKTMAELYLYWLQTAHRDPRFTEQNYKRSAQYYEDIFKDYDGRIPQTKIDEIFSQVFQEKAHDMHGIVPQMTIHQFINSFKNGGKENANC